MSLITQHGFGLRELLKHALGGKDPNNILSRLTGAKLIHSVRGGLPHNRAYYLPSTEKALSGQALEQRLAVSWHCLVAPPGVTRFHVTKADLEEVFGLQAPSGPHAAEFENGRWCVRRLYVPLGDEVMTGASKHVRKAQSFPSLEQAVAEGLYGFSVLVPWSYQRASELRLALSGKRASGFKPLAGTSSASFRVEGTPRVSSLSLALKYLA